MSDDQAMRDVLGAVEITTAAERVAYDHALPSPYSPHVAGYARGPFLEPELVTPSAWQWRGTRTYVVRAADQDWRAIRVSSGADFIGYWAVELLGLPLTDSEDL